MRNPICSQPVPLGHLCGALLPAGCPCRSLLVLLNPNSGHRQGRRVWRRLAEPVFAAAGIKTRVWETRGPGHASEMVAGLTAQQLQGIDGGCGGGGGVPALRPSVRMVADSAWWCILVSAMCACFVMRVPPWLPA